MSGRRALALSGSPGAAGSSTSESLARYLLRRLEERGFETEFARIGPALRSEDGVGELLAKVGKADLLILAAPLYVDGVPSPVIRTMERIAAALASAADCPGPRLVAMVNSGFPEARQIETALAIYRQFAKEAGLKWAGGLALGGGGVVSGKPLDELGGRVRNVTQALDQSAEALAAGLPVPEEAVSLLARPSMPGWLYTMVGSLGWRLLARKNKTKDSLKSRPHQP
jgi:hypothetical protein